MDGSIYSPGNEDIYVSRPLDGIYQAPEASFIEDLRREGLR